mmetsp:Transcript_103865/g.294248  ORF Transcript_103865/g.294248 Transcript_103865/m.294248 type:complete len:212 (+) Transcript_103865:64-699(+)
MLDGGATSRPSTAGGGMEPVVQPLAVPRSPAKMKGNGAASPLGQTKQRMQRDFTAPEFLPTRHPATYTSSELMPYSMKKSVNTARYHPAVTSPNMHRMKQWSQSFDFDGGADLDGASSPTMSRPASSPGLQRGAMGRSASAPNLQDDEIKRPLSSAGGSHVLRTVGSLVDVGSPTRPKPKRPSIPAGVVQANLNPSIPFSGFPNLTYLRGR